MKGTEAVSGNWKSAFEHIGETIDSYALTHMSYIHTKREARKHTDKKKITHPEEWHTQSDNRGSSGEVNLNDLLLVNQNTFTEY